MSTAPITELDVKNYEQYAVTFKKMTEDYAAGKLSSDTYVKAEADLNSKLCDIEQKHQAYTLQMQASLDEQKANYLALEKKMCSMNTAEVSPKNATAEVYKAINTFVSTGITDNIETKSYMRTDSNVLGGFLMRPVDIDPIIITPITEISPIRSLSKVRKIASNATEANVRASLVKVYGTKEGDSTTQSTSTYAQINIPVHQMTAEVHVTQQAINGAMIDMEQAIQLDIVEAYTQKEGEWFVNGSGVSEAQGFMLLSAGVPRHTSGTSGSFTFDDLIDMVASLKKAYNPVWGFGRQTMARLRKLKDTNGQYLWMSSNPGLATNAGASGAANSLLGFPYYLMPDMPDTVGAGTENVILADFKRMYEVVDAYTMNVIRDANTLANLNTVRIFMHRYVGGGVRLREAGVILKNGA